MRSHLRPGSRPGRGIFPSALACAFITFGLSASSSRADNPAPTPAAPPAPTAPATPNPVVERAQALREAASLLEKADAARGRGNRSFAEQLFSSAELIVGPEALSELAELFRKGAPPRINTPLQTMAKDTAPQPAMMGESDQDEPDEKPKKGSLSGTVQLDVNGGADALGVVTLEPASGKWHHRSPKKRVMEQRNRQFAPRLLVVPVGSTVSFPNFDPVFHNVFSMSEARPFDLGLYKNGQTREVTFDKEGVVSIECNLHANMSGHVAVVAAPYYAITRSDGKFSFKSLEPGTYKMRIWNERSAEPVTQTITIKPDKNVVTVSLKAVAARGPSMDKFGVARGAKP